MQTYEGDVELHVYSIAWNAYGHSNNPDFDNATQHVYCSKKRGENLNHQNTKIKFPSRLKLRIT
ncbi:MAG TPA: DUF2851 family protein [Nitrospinaceae bacterium]|nr:DUF2851 family protein [Nitrospinaceae bacterium]